MTGRLRSPAIPCRGSGGGRCLAVEQWIGSLIACGPRAVRIQKWLVIDWDRMSTTDAARAGIQAYVDAYRSDEPRRLMTAFLERRRSGSAPG